VLDTSWSKSKTSEEARAFEAYSPVPRLPPRFGRLRTWASYPNSATEISSPRLFNIGAVCCRGHQSYPSFDEGSPLLDDALPRGTRRRHHGTGFFTASSLTGYAEWMLMNLRKILAVRHR